jgi:uncharacterized membrane protein YgaE (UPF0421/DUF939 family)
MMIGVTLGIGVGSAIEGLIGPGALPIAVAALIALCVAVFIGHGYIGQGMMFANQTVVSAILVLALYRSNVGLERIDDALIGGIVAVVFAVLLFPADPRRVLRSARTGVLTVLHGVLSRTGEIAAGTRRPAPDWPLRAVDRVHAQVGALIEARATAAQVVRVAPRRWWLRSAVRTADHQAVHVALLAGSVLQLARAVAPVVRESRDTLPEPVHGVLANLAKATSAADADPAAAAAYVAVARHHTSELHARVRDRTDVVLADVMTACVDDLTRVIELRGP